MNTPELLSMIQVVLSEDSALRNWCIAQFGRPPTICIGLDEKAPPVTEDYPVVAVVGVNQLRGDTKPYAQWEVLLGVGVVNDEVVASGNVRVQSGLLQAETLRELTENALYRARVADMESAGDASSISYFPLFVSFTTVTVKVLKSTRRGLP